MLRVVVIKEDPRARFLYLEVPKEVRSLLEGFGRDAAEAAGGEADACDHVTLCYVPKADEPLDDGEVDDVVEALTRAVSGFGSFDVWIGGVAYFDTAEKDGEKRTALVALVDGPGLQILHETVRDAMREHGWVWEPTHSFTAHLTLAYLPVGGRVGDLPTLDAAWTVDEIRFVNSTVHRIPLGGERTGEDEEDVEEEGIGDRIEGRRKEADLQGEGLRRFRTTPPGDFGELYSYCSDCVHLARGSSFWGCEKGDDADVLDYSARMDRGATSEAVERCPLYSSADEENPGTETILQASLHASLDSEAGMIKEVPGEVEEVEDEDLDPWADRIGTR